MIYTAIPPPRLRDYPLGATIQLEGDGLNRRLVVSAVRDTGFIDLNNQGKLAITASPDHKVLDHASTKP